LALSKYREAQVVRSSGTALFVMVAGRSFRPPTSDKNRSVRPSPVGTKPNAGHVTRDPTFQVEGL